MITVANEHTTLSVGCFAPWLPAELVRAVGGLATPLRPGGRPALEGAAPSLCGVARAMHDLVARGGLDDLDAVVFGTGCDVARNLASLVQRRVPGLHVECVHDPRNVSTDVAVDWFELELERVLRGLALRAGERVEDDDLEEAILAYDRVRLAIERLDALRREEPWRLSVVEHDAIVSAALAVPAEGAESALREARIRLLGRCPVRREVLPVLAVGAWCARPPRELLASLEAGGLAIVDDDLNPGLALLGRSIGPGPERPLRRIARAFIRRSRFTPPRGAPETILGRAREAGARGVLLLAARACEPVLVDAVPLARTLDEAGVPLLRVDFDEGAVEPDRIRDAAERFVASFGRR